MIRDSFNCDSTQELNKLVGVQVVQEKQKSISDVCMEISDQLNACNDIVEFIKVNLYGAQPVENPQTGNVPVSCLNDCVLDLLKKVRYTRTVLERIKEGL